MRSKLNYRSVALLCIPGLGERPPAVRAALQDRLTTLSGLAVEEAGVPPEHRRSHPGADHLLLVTASSPFVMVTAFIRALDERLHESEVRYRSEQSMRLVVALDHGPVSDREGYPIDEVVARCNRLAREPAADGLASLVVIVADAFHREVVTPGHRGINPSSYTPLAGSADHAWIRKLGSVTPVTGETTGRQVTLSTARRILRDLGEPDH